MITNINTSTNLFIDSEFATIPYSKATQKLNQRLGVQRNSTPFPGIESGKFRRLFDRHTTAFRRR